MFDPPKWAAPFLAILKVYAPIMPFITEQIYQDLYREKEGTKSIHLSRWPEELVSNSDLDIDDFVQALAAIDEIRKHKAEQQISLGKELDSYSLKTQVNLSKYGELLKYVGRVKGWGN